MKISKIVGNTQHLIKSNSPTILTALGVSGVITTAYLTGKASFRACNRLSEESPFMPVKEQVKLVWKFYIPAGIAGAASVSCIIAAQRVGSRRTAAAQAAFSISERAFSEYRDKVIETIGENKEKKLRDEIAQDRVTRDKSGYQGLVAAGPGSVICCEEFTGRYFLCDMEKLRKAQNDLNARLVAHDYAYLVDFYELVGLGYTSNANYIGWQSDKLMELDFSTALTDEGKPCLVFKYNYTKPL